MKKDPKILLFDILESIDAVEKYTKNISKDKFFNNLKTQDAVIRRIEIIGEAVKHLSVSFKNKYSNIKWKEIAGTRDVLIHNYAGVDVDLVWEIIRKDILILKKYINKILPTL